MNLKNVIHFFVLSMAVSVSAIAQTSLEGVSSGRYEVRKVKARGPASVDEEQPQVKMVNADRPKSEAPAVAAPTPEIKNSDIKAVEPSISEQALTLFSDKAEKVYSYYADQTQKDDIRRNRVELDLAPAVVVNNSTSNYSFRNYEGQLSALKVRSNIWFTPRIGVSGQVLTSLAADVNSSLTDKSRVPTKYEFVDLGLNFRRFMDATPDSKSFEFSLLFSENKMTVPSDSQSRARLKSQGFGAGLKARIPSSNSYSWVFGGSFFPRLQHSEIATGLNIQSGSPSESIRIGVDFGGELKFSRESQIIWSIDLSSEKDLFGGVSSLPDPMTGLTPSNVSAVNSMLMFSLGYRWGS